MTDRLVYLYRKIPDPIVNGINVRLHGKPVELPPEEQITLQYTYDVRIHGGNALNHFKVLRRGFFDEYYNRFEPSWWAGIIVETGEAWFCTDAEYGNLFVPIPKNQYLAYSSSKKNIRLARLWADIHRDE